MKNQFASANGIDTSTKEGRKNLDKKWDIYRKSDDHKDEIKDKISNAKKNARADVKQRQKADYIKNGGVAGSAGRMISHYAGALANPKQTVMQGRKYNMPITNLDTDRIGAENLDNSKILEQKAQNNDENIKKEDSKNNMPKDPKIGERQVE